MDAFSRIHRLPKSAQRADSRRKEMDHLTRDQAYFMAEVYGWIVVKEQPGRLICKDYSGHYATIVIKEERDELDNLDS